MTNPERLPPESIAARRRAADRRRAINACGRCDDDGYHGTHVCPHRDLEEYRQAAVRGMALVRAALAEARERRNENNCAVENLTRSTKEVDR